MKREGRGGKGKGASTLFSSRERRFVLTGFYFDLGDMVLTTGKIEAQGVRSEGWFRAGFDCCS